MTFLANTSNNNSIISNWFAIHFEAAYDSNTYNNDYVCLSNYNQLLPDLVVTRDLVEEVISNLDAHKGGGTDGLPNFFVKQLKESLSDPLSQIFNKSLRSGVFPASWKETFIIPVLKSGDASHVTNYRPISILNCFSKIFEKVMHSHIFGCINNVLSNNQHGFFKKRSTVTNLVEITDFISKNLDNNTQVDVVYTDFSKAFDRVNHNILLCKLENFGFSNIMLIWFKSYLSSRSQYVNFNGTHSKTFLVASGIPQGSILGPLLFLIFINDIPQSLSNCCLLYADDLKFYRRILSNQDCISLQSDINQLFDWSVANGLSLNVNKCCVMSFSRRVQPLLSQYTMNGVSLERPGYIKDLGVNFDTKLSFNSHIDTICKKSYKLLGFLHRNSKNFSNINTVKLLYNSLVRNQLEYATQIWSPFYSVHIERIERVQRRFSRFLLFKFSRVLEITEQLQYSERLKLFNMISLESRRLLIDEITLYKIINNLLDSQYMLSHINFNVRSYYSRNQNHKLFRCGISRTNIGLTAPLNRIQAQHELFFKNLDLFSWNLQQYKNSIREIIS